MTGAHWRDDGHLTGDAISALADGELQEPSALDHAASCDCCLAAVGLVARRASALAELWTAAQLAPARRRVQPIAWTGALIALVIAFAGGRATAPEGAQPHPSEVASSSLSPPRLELRAPFGFETARGAGPEPFTDDCLTLVPGRPFRTALSF